MHAYCCTVVASFVVWGMFVSVGASQVNEDPAAALILKLQEEVAHLQQCVNVSPEVQGLQLQLQETEQVIAHLRQREEEDRQTAAQREAHWEAMRRQIAVRHEQELQALEEQHSVLVEKEKELLLRNAMLQGAMQKEATDQVLLGVTLKLTERVRSEAEEGTSAVMKELQRTQMQARGDQAVLNAITSPRKSGGQQLLMCDLCERRPAKVRELAQHVECAQGDGGGATTSTSSIRQLLGAADTQTAHHAASSTVPTRQLLGSANAETTPARAPATAADRK